MLRLFVMRLIMWLFVISLILSFGCWLCSVMMVGVMISVL